MEITSICYSIIIPAVDSRDVEVIVANFNHVQKSCDYETPIDLSLIFNNDQSIANHVITHSFSQSTSFPSLPWIIVKQSLSIVSFHP